MNKKSITHEEFIRQLKEYNLDNNLNYHDPAVLKKINELLPADQQYDLISPTQDWYQFKTLYPISKNGVIISSNLDDSSNVLVPELSENPYDPIPQSGKSTIQTAVRSPEALYIILTTNNSLSFGGGTNTMIATRIALLSVTRPELYQAITKVNYVYKSGQTAPRNAPVAYIELSPNNSYVQTLLNDSHMKRTSSYELVGSSIARRGIETKWSKSHTSGVSDTDSWSLAVSAGIDIEWDVGIPLTASAKEKLSLSITGTYGQSTTVSSQDTITQEYTFAKPGKDYKYDDYAYAVYQLKSNYQFIAGDAFNNLINSLSFGNQFSVHGDASYQYSTDTIFSTQTPDPTPTNEKSLIQVNFNPRFS
ncbi:hypothetical protein ABE42_15940 [Bacillus thuringiensis]|uniref:Cry1518-45 n=1 Tax=Bacillus thuringiensis YBT-1518 TaxID=529122 RepID=B7SB32_BACTU|nr:hypothetical protein [Bacillus thuringiensis]ABW88932.1 Cry1518-45 [Bacillus thuringiensis YBT-1518]AGC39295.1 pesticidial crystal protein Cry55Aa [Bacillus thuringiensis YBT-1518]MBG9486759.1 hypothetical protein [Bacillus thuringiensis]MBG9580654.1 hypothetical protein [Bacillus thuringiensis]